MKRPTIHVTKWLIDIPRGHLHGMPRRYFQSLSIVGPLTITLLTLKVSGIPMLEKKMAENPDFAEYRRRTSVFVPWVPKS